MPNTHGLGTDYKKVSLVFVQSVIKVYKNGNVFFLESEFMSIFLFKKNLVSLYALKDVIDICMKSKYKTV